LSARSDEFWRFVYVQQEAAALGVIRTVPSDQAPASFNLSNVKDQVVNAIKAARGGRIQGPAD